MKVSPRGLELISRHEGMVLHAYDDPAGHCTVGVGHLIHHGRCTPGDYKVYGTKDHPKLTRDAALKLLAVDVAGREAAVTRLVTVKLNQNEFDALVSFVFNVGTGAFEQSTLLRLLNQNKRKLAAAQFARWVFARTPEGRRIKLLGLVRRRAAEAKLFLTPVKARSAAKDLPAKWNDHWRRPWLPKARRNIAFRHWLGRHGYLTPHFTKREAASKDGKGIPKALIPAARNHAFRLERLRHELGDEPMPITSYYRSPEHNKAVGGARFSKHMAAIASDHPKSWVDAHGGQDAIKRKADALNFNGIGVYPGGAMHLDSRHGPLTVWSSFIPFRG